MTRSFALTLYNQQRVNETAWDDDVAIKALDDDATLTLFPAPSLAL